jgi:hypothetical protein
MAPAVRHGGTAEEEEEEEELGRNFLQEVPPQTSLQELLHWLRHSLPLHGPLRLACGRAVQRGHRERMPQPM